jgi:2-iminobutanoate/2-iminopropanoate deaminase
MSTKIQIHSDKAAPSSSSYAQALRWGNLFFTTVVPYGMKCEIVGTTMEEQAKQTMENLKFLLEAAGTDFDHILRVTAHVYDLEKNFDAFERVYVSYFKTGDYPCRSSHNGNLFKHDGHQCLLELEVIAGID